MIIASASSQPAASSVAAIALKLATVGLAGEIGRTRDAVADAADKRDPLLDMRVMGELRELLGRRIAEHGGKVEDLKVRDRFGRFEREFTRVSVGAAEVLLLQVERAILADGSQLSRLDVLLYTLRGKTVRLLAPGLPAPTAAFNTLQKIWREEERIDIDCVPWSQVAELEQGLADAIEVLKIDPAAAPPGAAARAPAAAPPVPVPTVPAPVRVFVSYSHRDARYVEEKGDESLLAYVKGTLEREGFEFWWDRKIDAGELWDDEIRQQMEAADIALVLVSQRFLNSAYCRDVEVETFLARRKSERLVIFPVIVGACDWRSHGWLRSTQFEPREGRTIEGDYTDRGKRDQLYLAILDQLRAHGQRIRAQR